MQTQRIQFIDLMRGVAVVVMVVGHGIDSVLSIDARTTEAFRLYDAVRGFTAPIFLFVAGFAFTIVTEPLWMEYRTFSHTLRKRLLKVLSLLVIGYALHLPFFSLNKLLHQTKPEEYAQLFQVDVLHCVAVSILILQMIVLFSPTPRAFNVRTAAMTSLLVLAAPLIWSIDFSSYVGPALAPYFNQAHVSIFPLLPYSAFMLAGALVGHYFLAAQRDGKEKQFFKGMLNVAAGAAASGIIGDLLPVSLYPPHEYWKVSPNFFLLRLSAVLFVTAGFFYLKRLPVVLNHPLLALGQASLLVYSVHLVIVYGSAANSGLMQIIGQRLPYYAATGVAVSVLCGMTLLALVWSHVRTHHMWPSRFVQAGFVSTIMYMFFTNPW